jgi:hypothetical protein
MLLAAVLEGIGDDVILSSHPFIPVALRDLIKHYNRLAINNDHLPAITEHTTGAELKEALRLLSPKDQLEILYNYNRATAGGGSASPVETKEQREIREVATRLALGGLALISMLLVGAVISVAVMSGVVTDMTIARTLVSTAADIIKFILSMK